MSKQTTKESMMIVKLPYGDKEAALYAAADTLFSNYQPESYQDYFEKAVETNIAPGIESVYVHPNFGDRQLKAKEGLRNRRTLTSSPVVYIVVIKLNDKQIKSKWLKDAIGDSYSGKLNPYGASSIVYVGETNDIVRRTNQHLSGAITYNYEYEFGSDDSFINVKAYLSELTLADRVICKAVNDGILVKQYVIWDEFFTKSMTLDLEHKFIDYAKSLDNVFTLNGRGNPQRNYYKSDVKEHVCSEIWRQLSLDDPELFPAEHDIWNSELYKVSPYHALGDEQKLAVNGICDNVAQLLEHKPICGESFAELGSASQESRLVIVEGASGTGKSIVLSTLFVRLSMSLNKAKVDINNYGVKPNSSVCLIVNQNQQQSLYENLAIKLGLMRSNKNDSERVVYKAIEFINAIDTGKREIPDVVLIDEAHLLLMRAAQQYSRKHLGNQLFDILLRAKVVVAVLDPVQVVRSEQRWDPELINALLPQGSANLDGSISYVGPVLFKNNPNCFKRSEAFNTYRITLMEQFRVKATPEQLLWLDRLADPYVTGIDELPLPAVKNPYEIKVFDSPVRLAEEIAKRSKKEKQKGAKGTHNVSPLCRLLATYDWDYKADTGRVNVELFKVGSSWLMPDSEGNPPEGCSGREEDHFIRPWNYVDSPSNKQHVWSSDEAAENEVGSYFSIQGFDLNYAGVIIGPSITYRHGHIVVDRDMSKDGGVDRADAEKIILQQFKILLRRAIKGIYLFAVDPELQHALEVAVRENN